MGLMLAGVAHDLNNSLAGIVAYPEILLRDLPEYSKLRQPLLEIQKSGNRAAATVADLLTVARGVTSVKDAHNLNRLVETYLDSTECKKLLSLHPDVQCELNADAAQPFISCSTVHIRKSLLNLIRNATEAVSGKGILSVSTLNKHVGEEERSEFGLPKGEYVVLIVCDNGSAITSEDAGHIFEPFYIKKSMGRGGTGLGLTIVWNTMHDHNGRVRVESSAQGTCFLLYFPVIAEQKTSSMMQQS